MLSIAGVREIERERELLNYSPAVNVCIQLLKNARSIMAAMMMRRSGNAGIVHGDFYLHASNWGCLKTRRHGGNQCPLGCWPSAGWKKEERSTRYSAVGSDRACPGLLRSNTRRLLDEEIPTSSSCPAGSVCVPPKNHDLQVQ